MKVNRTAIRLFTLFILVALLIPVFTQATLAEEAYDDPSLPDVFDQTIPSEDEDESDLQLNPADETEELPAFTVAAISLAALGLLLGIGFALHHFTTKQNFSKKKK